LPAALGDAGGNLTESGMPHPSEPEFFFLPRDAGQRLCVHHAPRGARHGVRALVVYVHPFAEEMNKSRRMAALQARALADAGCAVLQIDLLGCGDSSGLLSDARWDTWIADIQAAGHWLVDRYPGAPLWLWGLRAGALLAAEAAAQSDRPAHLLLWQPMAAGKTQVQQFLRLKAAGSLNDGAAAKAAMSGLRSALAAGETVEVAGYPLPAALVAAMESATLLQPRPGTRVRWLEVSSRPDASLAPASLKTLEAWQATGLDAQATVVAGPAFWQTTEIEQAPALLPASVDALLGATGTTA